MKTFKFFPSIFKGPFICFSLARILICLILILLPDTQTFSRTISHQMLSSIITRVADDAEKQIVAIHGFGALPLINTRLQKEYHLNTMPFHSMGNACPAIGYGKEDIKNIIQARALDQSGVYYIFGTKAMLENHLFIAEWGFAKACLLNINCPSNLSNLGFTLNACKAWDDAVTILNYAKSLDPADSSIYVNLSYSYKKLHRYNKAINEIMIAMSFQPKLKKYREILAELKKLQKETKKYQITDQHGKNINSGLEAALDMLETKKIKENHAESQTIFNPSFSFNHPPYRDKLHRQHGNIDMIPSYDTTVFTDKGDAACNYFKNQAHLLVRMGDGMIEKAGGSPAAGTPIEKFISTGLAHNRKKKNIIAKIDAKSYHNQLDLIKDFASVGAFETANIFYGIAGKMYEMCGEMEPDPDMDKFLDRLISERAVWDKNFFKHMDKEKFSRPMCTYKICISKGDQGSIRISVADSWFDTQMTLHPTNIYKYQFKVSKGGDLFKTNLGNFAGSSISHSSYFEWKFGRGMTAGTELSIGGTAGKCITTKAGKSIAIVQYSFEN